MNTKNLRENGFDQPFVFTSPLLQGRDQQVINFVSEADAPLSVKLILSGWNYGSPTYHVIIEYGDWEQVDYFFMNLEDIEKTFNIKIK